MYNKSEEEAYLVLLDLHISETERAVLKLEKELEEFEGDNQNLTNKEKFLEGIANNLKVMKEHRIQTAAALDKHGRSDNDDQLSEPDSI